MGKKIVLESFAALLLAGCGKVDSRGETSMQSTTVQAAETAATKEPAYKFTKEIYPKVDASTATMPLSEAFAQKLLGLSKKESYPFTKHNTTHNAYENLLKKKADIIFVTEPSKEELKMASDARIRRWRG